MASYIIGGGSIVSENGLTESNEDKDVYSQGKVPERRSKTRLSKTQLSQSIKFNKIYPLTLSQTTNSRLFQTERVGRRQF